MRKITFVLLWLAVAGNAAADAGAEFQTLLDEHWEWTLANTPMMASALGDRRYNRDWADRSLAGIERQHLERRAFLRRTYAIDRATLSEADQLNYELFRRQLQDEVDAHQFHAYLLPFDHQGGIQNLDTITNRLRLVTVKDYEDWLARLGKLDDVIDVELILIFGGPDGSANPGLTSDNVDANDRPFSTNFPYLANPW